MEMFGWIREHWFDLIQTASIIAGFWTAVYSIKEDTKERRIENLFTLTRAHRDIWWKLYEQPELSRVLVTRVDLQRAPLTHEEELFVHTLILHLRSAFKARKLGMQFDDDAVATDIAELFVLPIPRAVWERSKTFQDHDFVEFVDACIAQRKDAERAA
jgi:hypothetical protein